MRYQEWLAHVFDHPVAQPEWYWALDAPRFEAPHAEVVELMARTFENAGRDLARYSDAQVNQGLWYLFSNGCSDFVFALVDDEAPEAGRLAAIAAIEHLYRDCFEPRCAPVLGHLSEEGSPLNLACYMLWDISPLTCWEGRAHKQRFEQAVLAVLRGALACRNDACIESALHGLGHLHPAPGAEAAVRQFIVKRPDLRPELRLYAERAATGYVL